MSVQHVLPFISSWISTKAGESNIYGGMLVTCRDGIAVYLVTLLSIQCFGMEYSHTIGNWETEAWGKGGDSSIVTLKYLHFSLSKLHERPWNKRSVLGKKFVIPI